MLGSFCPSALPLTKDLYHRAPPCSSSGLSSNPAPSTWLIYLELTDTGFSSPSSFPKSASSIPITRRFQPSPGERSHLQDLPSADCPRSCLIHRRLLLRLKQYVYFLFSSCSSPARTGSNGRLSSGSSAAGSWSSSQLPRHGPGSAPARPEKGPSGLK